MRRGIRISIQPTPRSAKKKARYITQFLALVSCLVPIAASTETASCKIPVTSDPVTNSVIQGRFGPLFSTFFGGSGEDTIRDIVADPAGNVYVTGGTASTNFPTTSGAYSRTFSSGGTSLGSAGPMDAFVAKFSPGGRLLWSTYLGGPNYDRGYAIELDSQNNVVVAGRAGEGFPTTQGTVQPNFGGQLDPLGAYGKQDGFVAKLSSDGSRLLWATYFGGADISFIRDLAIDRADNLYIALPEVTRPNPHITSGALQTSIAGAADAVVAKLTGDGRQVVWATYLGGSADDGGAPSIRVNANGEPYVLLMTQSGDMPTTANAYDRTANGNWDFYVARLNATGSQLIYGTYLGGSGEESLETHSIAVDDDGNAYVTGYTSSTNYPTTVGVIARNYQGGSYDVPLSVLSADGSRLLASTFLGGSGAEGGQGIDVDRWHTVILGGSTSSNNFPTTSVPMQKALGGGSDFFVARLDRDLSRLCYSSLLGGAGDDIGRSLFIDSFGRTLIGGMTSSSNFPLVNAAQTARGGGLDGAIVSFNIFTRKRVCSEPY